MHPLNIQPYSLMTRFLAIACIGFLGVISLYSQTMETDPEILKLPNKLHQEWISNLEPSSESDDPQLVAWIELNKKGKTKNWALLLDLDEANLRKETISQGTLYTSTGRSFSFQSEKCELETSLYGPIKHKNPSKCKVKTAGVWVNRDYLSLGMHKVSDFFEAGKRYREINPSKEKLSYSISSEPITDDSQILPTEFVEGMGLTEAAERSFVGVIPAITEFFGIVMETDGLKDILLQLIPKSELFGALNPFGSTSIGISIEQEGTHDGECAMLHPEGGQICTIPVFIMVNDKPVVEMSLSAIAPEGPWKASAGIIAARAKSLKFEDRWVTIRVQQLDAN
jgi:hypothetical protein